MLTLEPHQIEALRPYQIELSNEAARLLNTWKFVYLGMQVRTGKTVTSLNTVKLSGFKKVLFLTKKKAIKSIETDYVKFGFSESFELLVTNNESLHHVEYNDFDCIIIDEAHRLGAYPKPSKIANDIKERFSNLPMIFLSGTPHPESKMQIFHQYWVSDHSPFRKYGNFYKWFNAMGFVKTKFDLGYGLITNYSNSEDSIFKYYGIMQRDISKDDPLRDEKLYTINALRQADIDRCKESNNLLGALISLNMVTYTQEQSGFTSKVNEHILYIDIKTSTKNIINRLIKDRVVKGKDNVILADTAVKLQNKIHQLYSGTIKFESGESMVIDTSKAEFIETQFKGVKIGIFYKFKEEYNALKSVYGDILTNDLEEFNSTNKNIALQIVSGREGISLKEAKYLVYYNIDFSAVSYWQSRDRLTTKERLSNNIYWIFSKGGIEEKIYKVVQGKKDFTLSIFKKQYGI
jgi:hypothetical protein